MSKGGGGHTPKKTALVSWAQIATATGYKVFWGTASGDYANSKDVGASLSYRVPNLWAGTNYYFSAKAYNAAGLSPYSNEVMFQP